MSYLGCHLGLRLVLSCFPAESIWPPILLYSRLFGYAPGSGLVCVEVQEG